MKRTLTQIIGEREPGNIRVLTLSKRSLTMHKFVIMLSIALLFAGCGSSNGTGSDEEEKATVIMPELTGASGGAVDVALTVDNFTGISIAGIELHITYDETSVTYSKIESDYLDDCISNGGDGQIDVVWASIATPLQLTDGDTLLTITFTNLAGASNLEFMGNCLIVDPNANPITGIVFSNGSISLSAK